jgi:aminotransferase
MMKIHQYGILCASSTAQDAAIEALEQGAPDVENMRREYELRRNFVVSSFNEMGLDCFKPFGSFYVFPSIAGTGLTSQEFSVRLLKQKSVAVVPGTAFGASGEGFVRACYATSLEQLKVAMSRIAEFVRETQAARAAA